MATLKNLILVLTAITLSGCGGIDKDISIQTSKQANPWTHLDLNNDPENFQFAIVADRTGSHRPGVFASAVDKLNLLNPEFVISVGDFIEGSTKDKDLLKKQWDEFERLVNKLQMPFFYIPGNHDIGNEVMADYWAGRFGRTYYHFTYHNVLFLCLNIQDGFSDSQVEYFQKALNANRDVRWTLIFLHQPIWREQYDPGKWQRFESLLADREYTVFAGHKHTYNKVQRNGHIYYTMATTGAGRGEKDFSQGQFNHIAWVTMSEKGPVIANLLLEGIFDDSPCE